MTFKTLVNQSTKQSVLSSSSPNARQLIDGLRAQLEDTRLYDVLVLLDSKINQLLIRVSTLEGLISNIFVNIADLTVSVGTYSLTASVNDFDTNSFDIIRLSSNAAYNVTGILAEQNGAQKYITNVGTFKLTLKHQSGSSAAGNRIICQGGADIVLGAGFSANMWYDAIQTRWLAIAE